MLKLGIIYKTFGLARAISLSMHHLRRREEKESTVHFLLSNYAIPTPGTFAAPALIRFLSSRQNIDNEGQRVRITPLCCI